jgi:predicted CXXCH cytochrome family protein
MTKSWRSDFTTLGAAALMGFAALGCVDEKVVYRDAPRWAEPPAAAGGFLGFARQRDTLTACGSCHAGAQAEWQRTAHATAWASLQKAGSAVQPFCESCHSVSSLGNFVTTENVGWVATRDPRYQDVQCESCHGPGATHVVNPTDANVPLASLRAATNSTDGCGACHNGSHHPYVAEWAASKHGTMASSQNAVQNPSCMGCHQGQAILDAFGVKDNYKEKGQGATAPLTITCGVCHDPHAAHTEGQLRFSISVPNEDQNLCMKCHHKRGVPDLTTTQNMARGPHSPEGPMILGVAGWWPPGLITENAQQKIETSHGIQGNPRLCATCHVERFEVTDKITGAFKMQVVGHSFEAIPCVDANGLPTGATNCSLDERRFNACTGSGCHSTGVTARNALVTARARLLALAAEVDRLVAQTPPFERSTANPAYTTAKGAVFNSALAKRPGSAIHNPFLAEQLLLATITQLKKDYGVTIVAGLDLNPRFKR